MVNNSDTQIIKEKINGHVWSFRFMPAHLMREGDNGTCWKLKFCIDIDSTLDRNGAAIIVAHEIVHAIVGMQGRSFQENFSEEDLCEFMAWNMDEVVSVRDKVLERRFGK